MWSVGANKYWPADRSLHQFLSPAPLHLIYPNFVMGITQRGISPSPAVGRWSLLIWSVFRCNLLLPSWTILLLLPTLREHLLVTPARITYPPITRLLSLHVSKPSISYEVLLLLSVYYLPRCHVFVRVIMLAELSRSFVVISKSHRLNLLQHWLITVSISRLLFLWSSKRHVYSKHSHENKLLILYKNLNKTID